MGANVEIKARLADRAAVEARARRLCDSEPVVLRQEDIFFATPRGRLKLRTIDGARGELIAYERSDDAGPRPSTYSIFRTEDPAGLRAALAAALGTIAVVRKVRTLYMAGRTRIHLDAVEGLGEFLELECVLAPGESPDSGRAEVRELMTRLGVAETDLVGQAYADLVANRDTGGPR